MFYHWKWRPWGIHGSPVPFFGAISKTRSELRPPANGRPWKVRLFQLLFLYSYSHAAMLNLDSCYTISFGNNDVIDYRSWFIFMIHNGLFIIYIVWNQPRGLKVLVSLLPSDLGVLVCKNKIRLHHQKMEFDHVLELNQPWNDKNW